ncbi:hypothetical protein LINPERPRIM_LOCUS31968, partial [Linum perenne]
VVLNTDESVITSSGTAIAGEVIRNELGRCLLTFSLNVWICSITHVLSFVVWLLV